MVRRQHLAIVVFVSLAACSIKTGPSSSSAPAYSDVTSSDALVTADMQPSFSAQDYGDGSGIHVYAGFMSAQRGGWVTLAGGDTISASNGAESIALALEPDEPDAIHYTSAFASVAGSTNVAIVLDRLGGQTGHVRAGSSSTIVAAPFTITSAVPAQLKMGDAVTIEIDPSPAPDVKGDGDSWQLSASGACIEDFLSTDIGFGTEPAMTSVGAPDAQGHFIFKTTALTLIASTDGNQDTNEGCELTIFVRHVHYGRLDPALGPNVGDLSLLVADVPGDASLYGVEGLQARAIHTVLAPQQ